jgi:hypothetical protein
MALLRVIQEGPRALRMKRPELPVYYYHDHFVEMLAFVRATYGSILTDEHDAFVRRFQHLSKDAQCLLIRMVNRRGTIFNRSLFRYAEISDLERAADDLLACGQARFLGMDSQNASSILNNAATFYEISTIGYMDFEFYTAVECTACLAI